MMRSFAMRPLFALCLLGVALYSDARTQTEGVELLLPGNEYNAADLPPNPAGTWWVLHRSTGTPILEELPVMVGAVPGCDDQTPNEQSGRVVTVPQAREPVLLLRGHVALSAGPVRTAFLDQGGAGEATQVEVRWGDLPLLVRHLTTLPTGDQPGQYRIELTIGDQPLELHTGQWHGDGHWLVRWIGDLNRDGLPDVLLDASFKYSVYTTRLFLSRETADHLEFTEAARFEHTAC